MAQAGQESLRSAFRMLSAGRVEALETVWNESARPPHSYAFALTTDHEEADNILSEVVGELLRSG